MKTLVLTPIAVSITIVFIIFSNSPVLAQCIENTDWPDAPCMDLIVGGRYPQDLVDKWAAYYDYKGAQFMKSKKIQMDKAIHEDRLMEWVDESIQNSNVWQYYYFSGQSPNPYPQNFGFDPIHRNATVNYYDFRNAPSQNMPCGVGAGLSTKQGCEFENFLKMSLIESQIRDNEAEINKTTQEITETRQNIQSYFTMNPAKVAKYHEGQNILEKSDLPWYQLQVNELTQKLTIDMLPEHQNKGYEKKISQLIGSDIDFEIRYKEDTYQDWTCTDQRTADCDPLVGGIRINKDLGTGCTLSLPVKQGTAWGFLTAAHCYTVGRLWDKIH